MCAAHYLAHLSTVLRAVSGPPTAVDLVRVAATRGAVGLRIATIAQAIRPFGTAGQDRQPTPWGCRPRPRSAPGTGGSVVDLALRCWAGVGRPVCRRLTASRNAQGRKGAFGVPSFLGQTLAPLDNP